MEVVKDLRKMFPTVMDRAYEQSREFLRVSDIMSQDVITISPEASMDEATKTMGEKHIGSLIAMKNGEPIGIVTERDLLTTFLARDRSLEIQVGEVCSSPLIAISSLTTVNETAYARARNLDIG